MTISGGSAYVDIEAALARAVASFRPNELAYLALTSNSESALRDRFAFELFQHPDVVRNGWLIAREYSRVDTAILNAAGEPLCLFELKHRTSFDMLLPRKRQELRQHVVSDIDKCLANRKRWDTVTEAYGLLSMCHPRQPVPKRLDPVIAYAYETNRAHKAHGGPDMLAMAEHVVLDEFAKFGVRKMALGAADGAAFGLSVDFSWFLLDVRFGDQA